MLIFFSSCDPGSSSAPSGSRELVPYPEKYEHDGYSAVPDSLKPEFQPDTAVGRICLVNSENVDQYLGPDIMDRLVDPGLPQATVLSGDKKQKLTVYFHPGSVTKEFSEFKVEYNNDRLTEKLTVVADDVFETESKIKLGISVGDLRSIKGEPAILSSENDVIKFHYQIDDFNHSSFLRRYNLPLYYADYTFVNGYLTAFKSGFEYP